MIRALIGKEVRQHGFALLFLLVLPFAGLMLISGHGLFRRASGGGFAAVQLFLITFLPLASLVLGQLLIAQEFRHKTQLFLEGLPLPRWRALAVKFALGLGLALLVVATALIFMGWSARNSEALVPAFAELLIAKSVAWTICVYSFFFATAFLGRYRVFFGLVIVFGFYAASEYNLPISEFGPFALVDQRFAYERFVWPAKDLAVTAGLILLFISMGFCLGLVRDATVAAMLAEKASAREKMFLIFLTLVLFMVSGELVEHHRNATPVQIPGATEIDRSVLRIAAAAAVDAPTRRETAELQQAADGVALELDAVTRYLDCRSFPPVFIVHRRDLKADEFSNGSLKASQGVMVRANLTAPGFTLGPLSAWLIHEALIANTHGLVEGERNAWILDGFEWWWPRSRHGEASAWGEALQAVRGAGKPLDFSPRQMRAWLTVRKNLGDAQARMLAGSVLALLAERHGNVGLRRFLADRLGAAEPADARGWLRDMLRPNSVRLRAATGLSEERLAAEWQEAIAKTP